MCVSACMSVCVCVSLVYTMCGCLTHSYVMRSLVTIQQGEQLTALPVNMFLRVCVCVGIPYKAA